MHLKSNVSHFRIPRLILHIILVSSFLAFVSAPAGARIVERAPGAEVIQTTEIECLSECAELERQRAGDDGGAALLAALLLLGLVAVVVVAVKAAEENNR